MQFVAHRYKRLSTWDLQLRYHDSEGPDGADMSLFAMMMKLTGRKCVVIGAGRLAAAKIEGLLACSTQVIVISPKAVSQIRTWAKAGKLVWHRRKFSPRDLKGAFLAIAATDSAAINAAVFRACQTRKVLCNSVDDPEHCDFFYPAVVQRGPLQIAISTSGRSPALAARLRRELARQFGPEWGAFVEQVGQRRRELLNTPPSAHRKRLLKQIAVPFEFRRSGLARAAKKRGSP